MGAKLHFFFLQTNNNGQKSELANGKPIIWGVFQVNQSLIFFKEENRKRKSNRGFRFFVWFAGSTSILFSPNLCSIPPFCYTKINGQCYLSAICFYLIIYLCVGWGAVCQELDEYLCNNSSMTIFNFFKSVLYAQNVTIHKLRH